jgi:maleate cis-trans isomerase
LTGSTKTRRVGFFGPPTDFDISPTAFLRVAPDDVVVTQTQMRVAGMGHTMAEFNLETIATTIPEMTACAQALARSGAELVIQFGTPFSLVHGADARQVQDDLAQAAGVPVVMAGVAMLDAAVHFDARTVTVASGYFNEAWKSAFRDSLQANGFAVASNDSWLDQGLVADRAESDRIAWNHQPEPAKTGMLQAIAAAPRAQAAMAFGGGVRMLDLADDIERETGMPAIGADIALYWRALQHLGLKPRAGRFGKLIDSLAV